MRVKVEACGLCHSDIHAANGDWPIRPSPPFISGHRGKRWAHSIPALLALRGGQCDALAQDRLGDLANRGLG